MKILHVTNFYKPSWEGGGVARVAYDFATEQARIGHNVTVYTTDGFKKRLDVDKNKPIDVEGVRVYYFKNLSLFLSKRFLITLPLSMIGVVKKEIKGFDAIHIHEHRTFLSIVVSHFARKYGKPYIIQNHGSTPYTIGKKGFKKVFDILFGRKIIENTKALIALNKNEEEQYKMFDIDPKTIHIIPNPISREFIDTKPVEGLFRKKYNIQKENILLYIGRINETKGLDLLIDSFIELRKKSDDFVLVLIGPDDLYLDKLMAKIKSNNLEKDVIYTGFISDEEKKEAIVDSKLFITLKFSGFPITFLESCAYGKPIITSTDGDKLDWLYDAGMVIIPNKKEISFSILKLINDNNLYEDKSKICKKYANKKFNIVNIVDNILNIYNI
jgi:glycosyltransferase involved in cell wall biosynthesis